MNKRIRRWLARWLGAGRRSQQPVRRQQTHSEAVATGLDKLDDVLRSYQSDLDSGSDPQRPSGEAPASTPEARTWGQLTLLRKLDEGGFGEVYIAHDDNLDRNVALKLRKVDRALDPAIIGAFLDEARRLAKVKHPNVMVVHGAAVHEQRVGIWMDLIEGKTLDEIVDDLGPLGPNEVVSVGRDLCRALAAVHEAGLLHGDLKPGNVMREVGGRIVLMDFGACLEFDSAADSDDQVICYGTAVNAAPEVLEGHRASVASDIYSLGVLLFFLLTGKVPVEGDSLEEVRGGHRRSQRRSLTDLRPHLPAALVHVVERTLSADPTQRFASAGAVESALNDVWQERTRRGRLQTSLVQWAATGIIATLVLASGWVLWQQARDRGPVGSGARAAAAEEMVVMTPLTTNGDQESELLALAVSDYLTGRLREAGLQVLAPHEVSRIVPSTQPSEIRESTGASRVVSGSVRARADGGSDVELTVYEFEGGEWTAQDVAPRHIALPLIPNDFAHFHNNRQSLAEDLVLSLAVDTRLPPDGGSEPTAPDAYRLALSADRLLRSTLCDDSHDLEDRIQQALARDPESSYYWWLLGNHYFTRVWGCGDPIALLDKAFAAASRADQLATSGDSAQAQLRHTYLLESSRTEDSYALALAHEKSGVDGLNRVALTLRYAGFLDQAEAYLERILAEDPIYFYRGNYGRAPNTLLYAGKLDRFLEQIPETGPYHAYYAGFVRMLQGEKEAAREVLTKAFEAFPSDMFSSLSRALFAILSDQPELARVTIHQLAASRGTLPLKDGEVTYKQAQLLALAGDPEGALDNLEDAVDQGFFCVVCIERDPVLARLADEPRFTGVVEAARRRHLRFAERFDLEPQL